ncbi:permease [Leucobacter weissii]|uniref:Permease n=1 Tax=Leucobacter weissii TaxID=1983706 RepID=A0A939MHX0_9MICO|nr:permease [Leucobacter weissii]MBO1901229.1 permease [Leucobacter weissii]
MRRAGGPRAWALTGIGALALFLAVRVLTSEAPLDPPAALSDFLTLSISVFVESLPFVVLGTLLSIVVQIWLPDGMLERFLPRIPVLRRAALSLLGILLPVCECGNVPLARGLMVRGFTVAEALTFLLAAPILNPVTILTTYHAFGWDSGILVARIVGGFVIANLIGWWISTHPRQQDLLTPGFEASCRHDHGAGGTRMQRSAQAFLSETGALLPALAIGSAIAGAIQLGAPRDLLIALGSHPLWSVLALLALAFVVAICSNVDSFFILSLSSTFTPGSIVAFLLFGAMMDIKMVALLRTTFTGRAIAMLIAAVALGSLCIGWGLNLVA